MAKQDIGLLDCTGIFLTIGVGSNLTHTHYILSVQDVIQELCVHQYTERDVIIGLQHINILL